MGSRVTDIPGTPLTDREMRVSQHLARAIEMVAARQVDERRGPGTWNAMDPSKRQLLSVYVAIASQDAARIVDKAVEEALQ